MAAVSRRFFFAMKPLPMIHHHLLICTLLLLLLIPLTNSQTFSDWFCGTSESDASINCGVACPTGQECPDGQTCFTGIDSCSPTSKRRYCGIDLKDANAKCSVECPTGRGCPFGEACFLNTICGEKTAGESSSSSSSSSTGGTTKVFGYEAVEETFKSMKDAINTKLFLYETPDMQWLPSTVYGFDGFFEGLQVMYKEGVNGKTIYMGGNDPDCPHCFMYGLVNIAAFLAQAMKETIRYDACDENSWDRVGDMEMYPISNACGQLGQSYQDYHCKEEERFMECEVDTNMSIKAVTHAKWWGAPGPLFCGPKSQYPHTGYWDFAFECNNQWANPPLYCDVYEGQKGGKHIDDAPYANAAGRTDVEGCCWWGRGVIQTSGVCNFGKLNYFLGKRAHDEGRESRYPDIDFCKDPEVICANDNYRELKWIAGFFYWVDQVQPYDNEGWNYLDELHKFVDGGMQGETFIDSVSGIVNRGCHNPPCGTGELDGGPERAENFFKVLTEMTFAFVDVVPMPPPTITPTPLPTQKPTIGETPPPFPFPTQKPTIEPPTDPPFPDQTPRPNSPPTSGTPAQSNSPTTVKPLVATPQDSESLFIEYICGTGAEPGPQTYIDVLFSYEIHNNLDTAAIDALKEAKELMLADIARKLGCSESFNRNMQQSEGDFSQVIGISSGKADELDPDVPGCTAEVQIDTQTTCTPAKGGFTLFVKSGTGQNIMKDISDRVKSIIEYSMTFGEYEKGSILKAIYIGDRVETAPDSIIISSEPDPSKASEYALYALIAACSILLCLLCMSLRSSRSRRRKQLRKEDEELAFDQYMENYYKRPVSMDTSPHHVINSQDQIYSVNMRSQSKIPRNNSRRSVYQDDLPKPIHRGNSTGSRREIYQSGYSPASSREGELDQSGHSRTSNQSGHSRASYDSPPPPMRRASTESASALAKDERRQRLEAAKARAASRRSARTDLV